MDFGDIISAFFAMIASWFGFGGNSGQQQGANAPSGPQATPLTLEQQVEKTKPQYEAFVEKAQGQVAAAMDHIMGEVQKSALPESAKREMIAGLQKEKQTRLTSLRGEFEAMKPEERVQLTQNAELQQKILQSQGAALGQRIEAGSKQLVDTIEKGKRGTMVGMLGDGSAFVSKWSGFGALAAFGVAGIGAVLTATGVGAPLGVPMMAASVTAGAMTVGGYALATSATSGLIAGTSHMANGEMLKGGIEAAFSLPGLRQMALGKAIAAGIGNKVAGNAVHEASELALKGGAVEGKNFITRFINQYILGVKPAVPFGSAVDFAPASKVIQQSAEAVFNNGRAGFQAAMKNGMTDMTKTAGAQAAGVFTAEPVLAENARVIAERVMRDGANRYMRQTLVGKGMAALSNTGGEEIADFLTPSQTPARHDLQPVKPILNK